MATEKKAPTKAEFLEALRKKGINNLEDLADAPQEADTLNPAEIRPQVRNGHQADQAQRHPHQLANRDACDE